MNHIKKNILFLMIEGSLEGDSLKLAEDHLKKCDRCFLNYASLKSSNMEINTADLEQTPQDLYLNVESNIGNIVIPPKEPISPQDIGMPIEGSGPIHRGESFSVVAESDISESYDLQDSYKYSSESNSNLGYLFASLSFVVLLTFMIYTDLTYDPSIPIASQDVEAEWLKEEEEFTMASAKTDSVENNKNERFRATKAFDEIFDVINTSKLENHPTNILAYFEPDKKKSINRSKSSLYEVANLSGMQVDEIEKILQIKSVRYIIYSYHRFKQIPEPGGLLHKEDTLKIYINSR